MKPDTAICRVLLSQTGIEMNKALGEVYIGFTG